MPFDQIKQEKDKVEKEIKSKVAGYITAAFGLVAGLAWNDAIKSSIEIIFPSKGGSTILAKFIYAILITGILALVSIYVVRIFKEENK